MLSLEPARGGRELEGEGELAGRGSLRMGSRGGLRGVRDVGRSVVDGSSRAGIRIGLPREGKSQLGGGRSPHHVKEADSRERVHKKGGEGSSSGSSPPGEANTRGVFI